MILHRSQAYIHNHTFWIKQFPTKLLIHCLQWIHFFHRFFVSLSQRAQERHCSLPVRNRDENGDASLRMFSLQLVANTGQVGSKSMRDNYDRNSKRLNRVIPSWSRNSCLDALFKSFLKWSRNCAGENLSCWPDMVAR